MSAGEGWYNAYVSSSPEAIESDVSLRKRLEYVTGLQVPASLQGTDLDDVAWTLSLRRRRGKEVSL